MEAIIIKINRLATRIFARFVITGENEERVLTFHKDATAEIITDKIREIVAELNEVETKASK